VYCGVTSTPDAAPTTPTPTPVAEGGPIAGLRVLELATLNAGPGLGAMLGDLGADVVKVELPAGDDFRVLGTAASGPPRPGLWNLVARNKRMVTLDYKQPAGVALLGRLTAVADVVVCNQPPALLERMDCSYPAIAARNPGAVVVQVSGWGTTGPDAEVAGNGTLAEAFAGLTDLQRDAEGTPRLGGALLGDHLTALAGVVGTLAALYWRDAHGGTGQLVDVALYEAVVAAIGPQVVAWIADPPSPEPTTRRPARGIRDTFETVDGRWVVVTSYSDAQIARLLEAVGVAVEPGSGGPSDTAPDLSALVGEWIGANPLATVLEQFRALRIGIAPVNDVGALLDDPHARARGAVLELQHPTLGVVRVPRPSPRLSVTPAGVRSVDRALGQDNAEVYAEWLGLDAAQLGSLGRDGVI
jgi:crotonobetainyl-CoA:carnitine CoA-transferase CaiB-like acyl-CoA transferase